VLIRKVIQGATTTTPACQRSKRHFGRLQKHLRMTQARRHRRLIDVINFIANPDLFAPASKTKIQAPFRCLLWHSITISLVVASSSAYVAVRHFFRGADHLVTRNPQRNGRMDLPPSCHTLRSLRDTYRIDSHHQHHLSQAEHMVHRCPFSVAAPT